MRPDSAQLLGVRGGDERLVRDVEADHRHVEAAREDALRGLGVGPDVELGRGRDVALGDRAAHQHDPLRLRLRVAREQERDVRQRAGGDERRALDPLGEEVDRVLGRRLGLRRRQVGAVEARLAVHVGGHARLAHERPAGAGGDRDLAAAGELEHADRVGGRLLERLVAGDRRDAPQLELGAAEREQDRDRVVVAGVAVEQDRRAHAVSISSTSAAVGSDGWAPAREAASAPAAQARRSASSRSRPSSSETTRHAVKASPAAVPSTASTRGRLRARPRGRPRSAPRPRRRASAPAGAASPAASRARSG